MSFQSKNAFKWPKLALCLMLVVMGAMAGASPTPSYAQSGAVQYAEELQLPDIPGTEWIIPAPVNECANPDPAWIFCDDFEQDRSNQYFEGQSFVSNNRTAGEGWNGSTAVKGAFKEGVVGAGGMKVAFGKTPSSYEAPVSRNGEIIRELYYRMYLKHDEDWTGGGGYKLSRVTSLTPGWAQPFIGHLWSGNSGPRENYLLLDPASGTDESGNLLTTKYNDFDNLRWLGIKQGLTPIFSEDYVGKWYSIEVHIKLNDPGQSNGVFEYWINNTLQASKTDMNWVGNYEEYGINTVLFENYWNNGAPRDQNRYFDNIVISTEKIDKDAVVNPESVSGGDAELGWYAPDGLVEGGELVVSTDGTFDFGDLGPTMLYRQTLADETPGTSLSTNNPIGRGTVLPEASGTPTVAAVPELPYGKGVEIGTPIKKIYVLDTERHTEFYEHYYVYWPAEHQDNAYGTLQTWTDGWGVKGIWHYLDSDGYPHNTKSDVFSSSPAWYGSGKYFTPGYKVSSNDAPIATADRSESGMRDPNDRTRWRAAPMLKQFWVKSGPVAGSAVDSDGVYRLTDTSTGMVTTQDYEGTGLWSANGADRIGFDRFTMPGHLGGFNIANNQHLYFADIYQAVGPGAAARIEITDNADYDASKKITILDIEDWSSDQVSATIRKGIFHDESLAGKHVHLHDAGNNHTYIGQLHDNLPAATAPGSPAEVTAEAGNGQAVITFTAPANDGGSAIIEYVATASPGGMVVSGTGSPIVFTGLTNGTTYTFTVKAVNAAGSSLPSSVSNAVTPSGAMEGLITAVEAEDEQFKQGVLIEGEDFTQQQGGTVTIADRGLSHTTGNPLGNMFYNWDKTGHRLAWEFDVPEAGEYRIGMKYSSSALTSLRDFQMDDGATYRFHYPKTPGGWSDYDNALLQDSQGNDLLFQLEAGTHTITMTNVTSGLNLDYIVLHKVSDGPDVPLQGGTAILAGSTASLQSGGELALTVGVSELQGSFTALDVIVDYDPELLAFATIANGSSVSLASSAIELLRSNYSVASAVQEAQGKIRILMFSQGEQYAIDDVGPLFKLHAKVKDDVVPGVTQVALERFDVSLFDASASLDNSEANIELAITEAEHSALAAAIAAAQSLHDQATEGALPGQYASGSKALLQAAIQAAMAVNGEPAATQSQVDAALGALNASISAFYQSVVPGAQVDKTALGHTLTLAQGRHSKATEGSVLGLYEPGSKALLLDAITSADAVYTLGSATQSQVDQAAAALDAALSAFAQKLVTLVAGSTAVSIRDLSIIARYYGVAEGDAGWSEIEKADVLGTGEISIGTLAAVAQMILDEWLLP